MKPAKNKFPPPANDSQKTQLAGNRQLCFRNAEWMKVRSQLGRGPSLRFRQLASAGEDLRWWLAAKPDKFTVAERWGCHRMQQVASMGFIKGWEGDGGLTAQFQQSGVISIEGKMSSLWRALCVFSRKYKLSYFFFRDERGGGNQTYNTEKQCGG